MHTTTINDAKKLLKQVIKQGINNGDTDITSISPYLHSSPGIGKSAIIRQIAEELNLELVDLRLASMAETDILGVPYVNNEGEQVFSTPDWFPEDPDSVGILFLDEMSNATINIQQAAYQLVLDKRLNNGKRLPKRWFTFAAGNLQTDRTGVKKILPALANRFGLHMSIDVNLTDFLAYATTHNFDTRILGFLQFSPNYLHSMDNNDGDVAYPTPRSWAYANTLLQCDLSESHMLTALAGCVGQGVAVNFLAFCKFYNELPDFEAIMDGSAKSEFKVPDDLGIRAALVSALIGHLRENKHNEERVRRLLPLMLQMSTESLTLIYRVFGQSDDIDLVVNIPEWTDEAWKRVEEFI